MIFVSVFVWKLFSKLFGIEKKKEKKKMSEDPSTEKEIFHNQLNDVGDGRFQLYASLILGVKKKREELFFFCVCFN